MAFEPIKLPSGYTQLDSISTDGSCYFDINYFASNNSRFIIDYKYDVLGSWNCLFGSSDTTSGDTNSFGFWYESTIGHYACYGTSTGTFDSIDSSVRHMMDYNMETITIDGNVVYTHNTNTFNSGYSTVLFSNNYAGNISGYTTATLYSLQIYTGSTLSRELVPCKNINGEIGLYDTVSDTFFSNLGTGTLTAGIVIEYPITKAAAVVDQIQKFITAGKTILSNSVHNITDMTCNINGIIYSHPIKDTIADIRIVYTGEYTDQNIEMDGKMYRLLTFITSGTLTLPAGYKGDIWMVGGGNGGGIDELNDGGGGGSVAYHKDIELGEITTVIIGDGASGCDNISNNNRCGGSSQFADYATEVSPYFCYGASGGGRGSDGAGSLISETYYIKGKGVSTYPFENSTVFPYPHSAGGGGGGRSGSSSSSRVKGGNGGSNGSDGELHDSSWTVNGNNGGAGGNYGGGAGGTAKYNSSTGKVDNSVGGEATYYGSGGGGAGMSNNWALSGGAGYQGVVYLRIPF